MNSLFEKNKQKQLEIEVHDDTALIEARLDVIETTLNDATPLNTPSTIVERDASGNFAAGTITAALTGNASTATKLATARTISLTGDATASGSFDGGAALALTVSTPDASTTAKGKVELATDGEVAASLAVQANDSRLSDARTPTAHASTHNAGGADAMAVDEAAATGSLRTLGTSATSACAGNDSRLSDARTPASHTHGSITNDGKIGTTPTLPIITTTGGALSAGAFGTAAGTFCQGNDARLADSRAPTAHKTTHEPGGTDAMTVDAAAATGSLRTIGTGAQQACAGNDSRLSDARTPTAHATNATTYGAGSATNYGHVKADNDNPVMDGTASPGTDDGVYARGDHVHPTDSSRMAAYTIPLDPAAYWSADETPDIPDYAAGITYLQDAWATVDGWTGWHSNASVSGGALIGTATEAAAFTLYKSATYGSGKTFRVKVKRSTAGSVYLAATVAGTPDVPISAVTTVSAGTYTIIDCHVAGAVTLLQIVCHATGVSIGTTLTVDWLYIGTAQYTTPLIDNSGNGRHATIYGATPVTGISGKALSFDGVNDYALTNIQVPLVGSLSIWLYPSSITTNERPITDTDGYWYLEFSSETAIRFAIYDTGGKETSAATVAAGAWYHCVAVWTGSVIRLYVNGIQIGADVSAGSPGALTTIRLANISTLWYTGLIDEPMIFSRSLSADEVLGLYYAKALPSKYSLATYRQDQGTMSATYINGFIAQFLKTASRNRPIMIGAELNIAGSITPAIAALNWTDIAFVDSAGEALKLYRWDGLAWAQVGNALTLTGIDSPSIAAMNETDIAFIDGNLQDLVVYRWDGTDWAQVGNELEITGVGTASLAALNSTDIALLCPLLDVLRLYRWDGTDWVMVGSSLSLATGGLPEITALNSTDIALVDPTADTLSTYRWSGSVFAKINNSLTITGITCPAIAALNSTDIAFVDSALNALRVYRWDGTNWAQAGGDCTTGDIGAYAALAALSDTDIAFMGSVASPDLRVYRSGYVFNNPWRYPFNT